MAWKKHAEIQAHFQALQAQFPNDITAEILGQSVNGQTIFAVKIGNPNGRKVLFDACIHGAEIINGELLCLYADWLLKRKEPTAINILNECLTILVPVVNPDGYVKATRKNQNAVDLNRNFQNGWCGGSDDPTAWNYKGTAPLSEPETQALRAFMEREKPRWQVDLHTGEPFRLYKQNGTVDYKNYLSATVAKYRQLCTARGLNPNEYTELFRGAFGGIIDDASLLGAYGFLWETHPTERTVYGSPTRVPPQLPVPFEEVEPIWFPKFLPLAIAVSEVEYIPPAMPVTPLILLPFIIVPLILLLSTRNR